MRRAALPPHVLLALVGAFLSSSALAQPIPSVRPLSPGDIFEVGGMRALLPGPDGKYQPGGVDLNTTHDGSALAFLVADPAVPSDLAEARRFEAALKKLPHTHGFLVIPPARSQLPRMIIESLDKSRLKLPTLLDNHHVFPVSFRHDRQDSPLYELFNRSQVLVIENASHLNQRIETGDTIGDLLRLLDEGKTVPPLVLPVPGRKSKPGAPPPPGPGPRM